ncbi:acyl-CoA dehydrogenase [Curtobacterium flaccumfaciens pv. oortii]|uniref:acyl-CoA dehydrogenase family protein n=1 Tax=Curtobacterium flaccumfaciens TaxID=2035 RepID=UPI001BDF2BEB|nr:acyl-CoA dehydrogenase family protein [Curtobacterium flaccumfaciens]MBT1621477.1 acyl-CoA dehydrogenase [Curtobacterium flaccumfaciens pv. oortii]
MLRSSAWPPSARHVDTAGIEETAGRPGASPADRLTAARTLATTTPLLSAGTAGGFLATLAAVAAGDVATARTIEPHLDALGILQQADVPVPADSTWGVFAAEGPGLRLEAVLQDDDTAILTGTKPWCSLASTLSHALVTAHAGDDRVLVAVDLRQDGVTPHDEAWVARGMPDVPSGPVDFDGATARLVGAPGWYLQRRGFAWGGIGVAACWWGGAVGLGRILRALAAAHPESELLQAALGATVLDLADAEDALADAAARIDRSEAADAPDADWPLLAQTVRSRVRRAVDAVRERVVATVGPAPLTSDPAVAARVADLELYVLQDHGARDLARIGRIVTERGGVAW